MKLEANEKNNGNMCDLIHCDDSEWGYFVDPSDPLTYKQSKPTTRFTTVAPRKFPTIYEDEREYITKEHGYVYPKQTSIFILVQTVQAFNCITSAIERWLFSED